MVDQPELDEKSLWILASIFKEAQGAPEETINMWTLAQSLGLDRAQMEDLAMGLVNEGLLEIKSLTGKVSLTEAGRKRAHIVEPGFGKADPGDDLERFVNELGESLGKLGLDSQIQKDLEIDLAALRGQMARSRRLPPVINALLKAIKEAVGTAPDTAASSLKNKLTSLMTDLD
ncbi:MAG: hypothetical protein JRG97_07925 [Deltaproteobacteria bacterium]|nr:hypothetical protein [Deltaproteobacteria bacterium]MBW2052390.1 hypothetical protein [Deltaproteobacteria bacterium]MBW2140985.1 hypothetical protein [Deltaproteobacteria bacterium]MBW2323154.1 hypothetical protein [Deltaproteobacteria bacterium]